jgi:hypothetical protein
MLADFMSCIHVAYYVLREAHNVNFSEGALEYVDNAFQIYP